MDKGRTRKFRRKPGTDSLNPPQKLMSSSLLLILLMLNLNLSNYNVGGLALTPQTGNNKSSNTFIAIHSAHPLDDEELTQELLIFGAEQTQQISFFDEMQTKTAPTIQKINEGGDDGWVPAASAVVIVLIVFSISVFACCIHCPFCCVYRMTDPQRIV